MIRKIYYKLRDILPVELKGKITKFVFLYTNKPYVRKDKLDNSKKFPHPFKGGIVISADFELAWAWRYAKQFKDSYSIGLKMAQQTRQNFPFFIKMFEDYNIPITWATVGHLFLEKCKNEEI